MFLDAISSFASEGLNESIKIIAFKECDVAAILAKEKVFMILTRSDKSLTSLRLVDALNEMKFLEFFKCAIHSDQAQRGILCPCHVVDLKRGEGAARVGDKFHNRTAGLGEPISIFLQLS